MGGGSRVPTQKGRHPFKGDGLELHLPKIVDFSAISGGDGERPRQPEPADSALLWQARGWS